MAEPSSLEPAGGTNDAPAIAAESMPPPDGADHRTCPRYGYGTVTLTRVGLARAGAACFAWIHDLCEHGIGLDVLAPLAAGVNIVVELKRGGGLKLRMRAQVVHATPVGSFFRLGCQFKRALRPGVLASILQQMRSPDDSQPE